MRFAFVVLIGLISGCGSNTDHPIDAAIDAEVDMFDACVDDCAGVCGGSATVDPCGVCDTDPTNDCAWPDSSTAFCSTGAAGVACPSAPDGQDGDYLVHVPAYVLATDTVTDPVTHLVWERNPAYTDIDEPTAAAYCDALTIGAATDWRLPTRLELVSLTDDGVTLPAFDHAAFPGVPQNSFFWTSTPVAGVAGSSWTIGSNYPVLIYLANTGPFNELVRCVHGATFVGALTVANGVVHDGRTNLAWQSDIAPTKKSWTDALAYCEALSLDGHDDWRLPSLKELASIVDDTLTNPAISPLFAAGPAEAFWSSSPVSAQPTQAYRILFTDGENDGITNPMTGLSNVRCVRSAP